MPAPHHSVFYRPDALPAAQPQRQSTEGKSTGNSVVKVDRRIRWHYTTTIYFAFALVHDSRGIEIVNFTTAAALSAGTLMASAATPYRRVPAHFYPAWHRCGTKSRHCHPMCWTNKRDARTCAVNCREPSLTRRARRYQTATKQTVSPPPLPNAPPLPRKLSPPGRPTHARADGQAGNITLKILCNGKRCMSCNL